jgi:hypothetical protein
MVFCRGWDNPLTSATKYPVIHIRKVGFRCAQPNLPIFSFVLSLKGKERMISSKKSNTKPKPELK